MLCHVPPSLAWRVPQELRELISGSAHNSRGVIEELADEFREASRKPGGIWLASMLSGTRRWISPASLLLAMQPGRQAWSANLGHPVPCEQRDFCRSVAAKSVVRHKVEDCKVACLIKRAILEGVAPF